MKKLMKKAFTLVELLVVIAIMAVLATISIISYKSFIPEVKLTADETTVADLNNHIIGSDPVDYPHKLNETINENGFDVTKLTAKSKNLRFGYDGTANKFVIFNDETHDLYDGYSVESKIKTWVFLNDSSLKDDYEANGYSIYRQAKMTYDSTEVTIKNSYDDGDHNDELNFTYTNTTTAQDCVIHTSCASNDLTVNDTTDSKIYHYGEAGTLNLIQCSESSFYERGKVAYVEFGKGRYVLEEASDVEVVNISKASANTYNNPIIADGGVLDENMPDIISRDQTEITDASGMTPLARVQTLDDKGNVVGEVEQVYAYSDGTTGSTEKSDTHNETITSTLGLKLVDDDGKAGQKAYDEDTKASVEEEYVVKAIEVNITSEDDEYVARIGTTGYKSVETALNKAEENETVYLLCDSSESGLKAKASNVTLNLADHNLTYSSNYTLNQWGNANYSLIIKGSGNIAGPIRVGAGAVTIDESYTGKVSGNLVRSGGYLYINGGIFDGSLTGSGTVVTFAGGSFKTKPTLSTNSVMVAEGYTIEQDANDNYYDVVPITAENAVIIAVVGGVTKYFVTLKDAQNAVVNGGTITLNKDFDYVSNSIETNYYPTGEVTIDLNGHQINLVNYTNFINVYSGTINLTDSVGTGTITGNNSCNPFKMYGSANFAASNITVSDKVTLVAYNYNATGNTTLTNVTSPKTFSFRGNVALNNCTISAQITCNSGSTVTINGGSYRMLVTYSGSTLNVNSGSIGYINNGGTLNIVTCIIDTSLCSDAYGSDPTAPSFTGCTVTDNGNGTWTVTKND